MALAGACLVFFSLVSLVACGPSVVPGAGGDDFPDDAPPDTCTGGATQCVGGTYQTCEDGSFVTSEACPPSTVCVAGMGCKACDPHAPRGCAAGDVVVCNPDGTTGEVVETCGELGCTDGACGSDCGSMARQIYVVTNENELMRFEPAQDANTFTSIGRLNCPAGREWPARGTDPATPYSMSVGRDGYAWVLYTSGELFRVSTTDASCTPTTFVPGRAGFQLFGMGFVTDAVGATAEHLFVAGGAATAPQEGSLGRFAPDNASVELRGQLVRGEFQPELTGTGNGELWAYYPGQHESYVGRLDPATAQVVSRTPLPALVGIPTGWAFAHWGGRFYVFISHVQIGGSGGPENRVLRVDPSTGTVAVVRSGLTFKIVGAGVSTCAPVDID